MANLTRVNLWICFGMTFLTGFVLTQSSTNTGVKCSVTSGVHHSLPRWPARTARTPFPIILHRCLDLILLIMQICFQFSSSLLCLFTRGRFHSGEVSAVCCVFCICLCVSCLVLVWLILFLFVCYKINSLHF